MSNTNACSLGFALKVPPLPISDTAALRIMAKADGLVVSVSGGKDSDAMLDYVHALATAAGCTDKLVAVNADLGEIEWDVEQHIRRRCDALGIELVIVKPIRTLLEAIERRGKWPDMARRFCTSDSKRDPIWKFIRNRWPSVRKGKRPVVMSITGERAQESRNRAKFPELCDEKPLTVQGRKVWRWRPIIKWQEEHVWSRINASGIPAHPVYAAGMRRLSCAFCVFASKRDLTIARSLRPKLFDRMVALEDKMNQASLKETGKPHYFREGFPLATLDINTDDGKAGPT